MITHDDLSALSFIPQKHLIFNNNSIASGNEAEVELMCWAVVQGDAGAGHDAPLHHWRSGIPSEFVKILPSYLFGIYICFCVHDLFVNSCVAPRKRANQSVYPLPPFLPPPTTSIISNYHVCTSCKQSTLPLFLFLQNNFVISGVSCCEVLAAIPASSWVTEREAMRMWELICA